MKFSNLFSQNMGLFRTINFFGYRLEIRRKKTFSLIQNQLTRIDDLEKRLRQTEDAVEKLRREVLLLEIAAGNSFVLDHMKPERLSQFSECRDLLELRRLLRFQDVRDHEEQFVRIGRDYDGGYVLFDEFPANSVVYSFGIEKDVSWEWEMARRGFDIFMFDPTIESLPEDHEKFHYFKIGIAGDSLRPDYKTMDDLLESNGHSQRRDLILKMDVEGCEWDFLNQVSPETLDRFSQIVFEFHEMTGRRLNQDILPALRKLNASHQLIHLHANNYGRVQMLGEPVVPSTFSIPFTLETTYLRRADHEFVETDRLLPTRWDRPNDPRRPEILLGAWNDFVL